MVGVGLGARAQAVVVLLLVGTVGALAGVLGDRMLARRSADDVQRGDTINVLSQDRVIPIDTGDRLPIGAPRGPRPRPGDPMGRGGPGGPPGGPQPAMRFAEMLTDRIDLTTEQRAAIDSIVAADREQIAQLTQVTRMRVDSIGRSTRAQINALLTPDQRAQLRTIQQERLRVLSDERRDRIGDRARQRPGPSRRGDTISSGF